MAAAPPARSAGASLSIDSYAPNRVVSRPKPSRTKPASSSGQLSSPPIAVRSTTAAAVRQKPALTMRRGPNRRSILAPARPAPIAAKVSGSSRRPVSSGDSPSTSWRYCAAISCSPTRASIASTMQPTDVLNAGRANMCRSTSGCVRRRCRRTKAASRAPPASSGSRVHTLPAVSAPPSRFTPSTTANSPPAAISAPSRSQGPLPSPFDSGSSRRPTGRLTSISGMLTRKTEPHQKCSSRKPPSSGPTAAPTAATALQMPMASARSRRSGKTCRRMDSVAGMIMAPPTPSSARAAMSTAPLSARAAMPEASPNRV